MSTRTYADDLFPLEVIEQGEEAMSAGSASPSGSNNSVEALNSRIHVGWMTTPLDVVENLDRQVAPYCTKLGESKYNFVCFPIGGVVRSFWKKLDGDYHPPVIDLPDVQLANSLWETYVNGKISSWIDCDSDDEKFAALSAEHLLKELNYVCYLGLQAMTIELKRVASPRTAAIINKWIWTRNSRFTIWVQIPSCVEKCVDYKQDPENPVDLWTVWADFRKQCGNFSGVYLQVALTVGAELPDEYIEKKLQERWTAEPIGAFVIESEVFQTGKNGEAELPKAHVEMLQSLWTSDSLRFLLRATTDAFKYNSSLKFEYSQALRQAVRDVTYKRRRASGEPTSNDHYLSVLEYKDVLQAPLQPLSENLDSGVYNTFEQDQMKYVVYGEAVEGALKYLGNDGRKSVVVYLLGGGRGPIGTKILRAEKSYNATYRKNEPPLKVKLYIVEKNPNAIVTLKYMNVRTWKRRVTIVESDMRSLPRIAKDRGFEQPDIIVSELLGSFGDNELSPECLDGVTDFLKLATISIPESYTSYVVPIMSTHLHQTIRAQSIPYLSRAFPSHGRAEPEIDKTDGMWIQKYPQGHVINNMDQIYVVYLSKYIPLASATKPVFTFTHPNFTGESNERSTVVEFEMDRAADLMGFAGYFDLNLFGNVKLSIEPSTHTPGMVSWFPAVIPLRDQLRVGEKDKLKLKMDRKVDAGGVWYEWSVELEKPWEQVITTPLQNPNGQSYYMRM